MGFDGFGIIMAGIKVALVRSIPIDDRGLCVEGVLLKQRLLKNYVADLKSNKWCAGGDYGADAGLRQSATRPSRDERFICQTCHTVKL